MQVDAIASFFLKRKGDRPHSTRAIAFSSKKIVSLLQPLSLLFKEDEQVWHNHDTTNKAHAAMTNSKHRKIKTKKVLCGFCSGHRVFVVPPDDWDGNPPLETKHLKRLPCPGCEGTGWVIRQVQYSHTH